MEDNIFEDHSATVALVSKLYAEIKKAADGYKMLEAYAAMVTVGKGELRCKLIALCRECPTVRRELVDEMHRILELVNETE